MVGGPRTKAKHVQSLADQQYALNDRLFAECPPMYLDGTDRRDPLAQSWRSAIEVFEVRHGLLIRSVPNGITSATD